MYVIVSPFSKTFDDLGLIYKVPDFLVWDIKTWQIVEIPLKNSTEIALVLQLISSPLEKSAEENLIDYDISKIKEILTLFDQRVFLTSTQIKLIQWIAQHYFTPIHNAIRLYFPKNLLWKIEKIKLEFTNKQYSYSFNHNVKLSHSQTKAYREICDSQVQNILLYWITWSGKTEVYIKLIQDNILAGKQTLILIPEIILTNQILTRLQKVFWKDVISINSSITEATKTKHWIDIYTGNAKVIIWTRSSLFYPYNNLATIIIDEEHDNSYISDQAPRYNAIEAAEQLTKLNGNKLILASGTPSVVSMYRAIKYKDFKVVNLLEKFS